MSEVIVGSGPRTQRYVNRSILATVLLVVAGWSAPLLKYFDPSMRRGFEGAAIAALWFLIAQGLALGVAVGILSYAARVSEPGSRKLLMRATVPLGIALLSLLVFVVVLFVVGAGEPGPASPPVAPLEAVEP